MVVYLNRWKNRWKWQMPMLLGRGPNQGKPDSDLHAWLNLNKEIHQAMTKSLEVISEAIRHPKHPFRKVDNQPNKPLKHRYERRKIRSYLHLGEWMAGEAT